MALWIKNPLSIWTATDLDAAGGLVVDATKIIEVVGAGKQPTINCSEVFDASKLVIIPGLVNCHHHFYQTLTRAFPAALNKELFAWLQHLYPVWAGLDETCIALSTRLAIAELMLSGCSMVSDHHYLFNSSIGRAIDIQIEECISLGVRAVLTRGSMSLGAAAGGLPPDSVVQTDAIILRECERLLQQLPALSEGTGASVQLALAPCSPFSVTPELMRHSAELARRYGALLHTHLAETEDENNFCLRKFGVRPVDYLADVNWLADDVWLAHGIHFTPQEITRLGAAGVAIAHCPSSNMLLSSGLCQVQDLECAGCPIGLGVDGSASNDSSNMMQEIRQAFLLQRLYYGAARVTHEDALRWGTIGGANLFRRSDVGTLAVGSAADIAFFNLDDLRFSGAGDPIAALVLCGAHQVDHLMVAGQWRVRNGEIPGLDLPQLRAQHQAAAQQLAAKLNN